MTSDLRELLPSDLLADEELDEAELAALADAFAALALAEAPMTPSAGLREAVLEGAQSPLSAFAARLARLVDVSVERARELIARIADPAVWEPGVCDGMFLCHLPAGPSLAGAVVGFVRVTAGMRFPRHTHVGDEVVMVMQGGIHDESGAVYLPGDIVPAAAGTTHEFRALPGEELIYLAVVDEGVDFGPEGGPLIPGNQERFA